MTPEALIILDLSRRHMNAMKDGDEKKRMRLFQLLTDFEWAYPDAVVEVNAVYPVGH